MSTFPQISEAEFEVIEREKNNQLPLIEWINKNVSPEWSLAKELQYGVAIHDGSLQKHIGASIIH